MAVNHNFRTALGGFNREDVVRYIEFLNAKHTTHINQLNAEAEELRKELNNLKKTSVNQDVAASLEAKCAELTAQLNSKQSDCDTLEAKLAAVSADHAALQEKQVDMDAARERITELEKQIDNYNKETQAKELEAYRRAEQAERSAKERADRIYQQATGTLAQATTQVDAAADSFRQIAENISAQIGTLQAVVADSKNALRDAAATMYALRPAEEGASSETVSEE